MAAAPAAPANYSFTTVKFADHQGLCRHKTQLVAAMNQATKDGAKQGEAADAEFPPQSHKHEQSGRHLMRDFRDEITKAALLTTAVREGVHPIDLFAQPDMHLLLLEALLACFEMAEADLFSPEG